MQFSYVLLMSIALIGSNSFLLSPILSEVAGTFNVSPTNVSLAITVYNAATALAALALSPLIDKTSPTRVLGFSYSILISGLMLSWLSPSLWVLIIAQAACGIGAGIAVPSIYLLASTTAPSGQEAKMVGRALTGWSLALVGAVPSATILTELFGWRACFAALTALSIVIVLAFARLCPPTSPAEKKTSQNESFFAPFRVAGSTNLLIATTLYMAAFYGIYSFLGTHLKDSFHVTAVGAGYAVLAYGLGFGFASFGDGLINRFGAKAAAIASLIGLSGIYLVLGTRFSSTLAFYFTCFVWGLLNHFGLNSIITLIGRLHTNMRGRIMGMNSVATYAGGSIGTFLIGLIYRDHGFFWCTLFASVAIVVALLAIILHRSKSASVLVNA